MAPRPAYDRFSDEDGEDVGMISSSAKTTPREPLAYKSEKSDKIPLWKWVAAGVAFVALLVPAVGYTSSVLLEYRVAQALQEGQPASTTAALSKPAHDHAAQTLSNPSASSTPFPSYAWRDCGSNADEARANGCEYDVMMQEWQPPECMDKPLAERYLKNGNWTWYANSDASKIYNDTEIALGNHDRVYVDQSYHRHHCIFAWERMVRAMRTQKPLIEKMVDYDHVMHCKMNTLRTFEEGAQAVRGVVAPTAFTSCASYDVWLSRLPANKHSTIEKLRRMALEEPWSAWE